MNDLEFDPNRRYDLEIAKLINEPINTQLRVPIALSEIADTYTAEPGEHVWRIKDLDNTADVVLNVDANGKITPVKRTPLTDVQLTFSGFNTKQDYVLLEDVLNKVDTDALSRRKEAITRAMDKKELKLILDALLTPTNDVFPHNEVGGYTVSVLSGDDIYDVFIKAVQGVEDYGDNYVALVGSTVKNKIDTYDKDNVQAFRYNVELVDKIAKMGVSVRKIIGKVAVTTNEAEVNLLDKKKMILVARDSSLNKGKPIQFVRRRISPSIAKWMGVSPDSAERAIFVSNTPMQINIAGSTDLTLAFGIYGYESIVICVKQPRGIATADLTNILA